MRRNTNTWSRHFFAVAVIFALALSTAPPVHADALRGAVIGAGVGALVGGKNGVRNGAIIGAVAGGVKRSNRRRR